MPGAARVEPRIESRPEPKSDPLAELARIVGQDDPFRALLEARDGRRGGEGAPARRVEPSFVTEQVPAHQASAHSATAQGTSPADAFDQYLASVDRDYPAESGYHGQGTEESAESDAAYVERSRKPTPHRRRLVSVGAGIAVVAISVTGALTWRSLHSGRVGGGVPVIQADTAPLKIAPKTADGVEIPDQNKQIYEPKAKDGQIRIVNREEQPLDVAQAARAAGGTSAASQTAAESGTTPGGLTDAFGEPRRVRTVSVKPDTPPPPAARETVAETATPSVIPTMTLPGSEEAAPKARPARQAMPLPTPAPTPTAPPPAAESTPVVPAPAPTRAKAPQRVASVAPEATAAVDAPATTAATSPSAASVGGFAVQLGVRTSAAEAQTAFKQMQGKYTQLAGQPELIRQAEVNGKTIWRVRVGPLGKNEATSLCNQLQAAGGQCFVAKN
ncbi:SPOR domain-containing protein [Methylobacterium durans]|uniref:SPOR domain-containing protein n=1 Tax=Methylobacterium durans TaxID=2202825 RepID=A0A2U8WCI6_9HYPH|nr:SPOR domain-containing protein [Methylobacterium durans]AWN43875.1 SPOR domain-containing protein [Methylobacterium durans]